jgi:hypothetical protein
MKEIKILLNILLVSLISCNKPTEPPPPPILDEPTLRLELDDAHCTEVWIKFTSAKLKTPNTLILKQYNPNDDSLIHTINLITQDTLLHIDSLLPNKTYRYKAEAIENNKVYTTNELIVQTMDTTSHIFTFEMFTFGGEIGSSVLYDVAIINKNNIWAVGDIWIKSDTSATGYIKYNAVHWNGKEWKLHRIMFYTICGQYNRTPYPAKAIFVFNENDIWIAMDGDQIARMNGTVQVSVECLPYSFVINKIWGTSSNNLYVVGNLGNILHYNGKWWRRIESHTTLNIYDIWGDYNPKTNEWEILAVASDYPTSMNKEILKIAGETVFKLPISSQMEPLYTVWFTPNKQYYVAGSGIYQKRLLTDLDWKNGPTDITGFATTCIRGNNINDVFGVGAFGDFLHYNGVNWESNYQEPLLSNGAYGSVAIKGNLIAATGYNNREAVILIGRR